MRKGVCTKYDTSKEMSYCKDELIKMTFNEIKSFVIYLHTFNCYYLEFQESK